MIKGLPNPKELAYYYSLAQIGFEMVAPIALGLWLDVHFGWLPWATVIGVVVGLVGGFVHLMVLLRRHEQQKSSQSRRDPK